MAKLDDISWHLAGGEFPANTPDENAATHIGMFVTWAIDNNCWGQIPGVEWSGPVEMVRNRATSGRAFVLEQCDGKLFSEMMTGKGALFAESYYPQTYLKEFQRTLSTGLTSDYLVQDTWENYERMARVISSRYARFVEKPWWKVW